ADHALPTVPRWNANKMPLTNKVAREIIAFRSELRARFDETGFDSPDHIDWIAKRLDSGRANAAIIYRMHAAQAQVSKIPTDDFLLVEEYVEAIENVGAELRLKPGTR